MRVILLGPPGAGKGTQARRVAATLGLTHLSSGEILRSERASGSELGRRATEYMDAGRLVPDEIIIEAILSRLPHSSQGGALLDGFPRTVAQAESLDRALAAQGLAIDRVVDLRIADEPLVERITGRRVCTTCQRAYHVRYQPPKIAGRCDDDQAALEQRSDDTKEVVKQRLAEYYEKSEPLAKYYRERGVLREVDGDAAIDSVTQAVLQALGTVRTKGEGSDR